MTRMATVVPPLLQSFVDAELGQSADLIARTLAAIQSQLRHSGDGLLAPGSQTVLGIKPTSVLWLAD